MKRILLLLAVAVLMVVSMSVSGSAIAAPELTSAGGGGGSGRGGGGATLEFPMQYGGTIEITSGGGGGGDDFSEGTDVSPGENSGGSSGFHQTTDTGTRRAPSASAKVGVVPNPSGLATPEILAASEVGARTLVN